MRPPSPLCAPQADFTLSVLEPGPVEALCGFFDTQFKGSQENPTDIEVTLSTAPDPQGATHWGQQCFFLNPAIECAAGDKIECTVEIMRRRDNQRLMDVTFTHKVTGSSAAARNAVARTSKFHIE